MLNKQDEHLGTNRITDWPQAERPREKLMTNGAAAVSNAELIAILLGQGTSRINAVDTARLLLRKFGSVKAMAGASLEELQTIPGIGPAKAVTLMAAFQLYRNMLQEQAEEEVTIFRDAAKVAEIYIPQIGHHKNERFYVVLLDSVMRKIKDVEITKGLLNQVLTHPREVFNPAIRHSARGIIILHNHPSGVLKPSPEDFAMTKRLVESGKILDIPVYDHLIITEKGYYSFRENGYI